MHGPSRKASRIPQAHLVLMEGSSLAPYLGDSEAVLRAISEFLGESVEPASVPPEPSAFRTVLFTDV